MLKFSNFGKAILASAPSGTTGLAFTVEAGKGLYFPSLGTGDYFYGIFKDASGNREVVKVEARSTDAMTIAVGGRGLDGTTARTWAANDYFVAGLVNVALQETLSNANLTALGALPTDSNTNLLALGGVTSAADKLPYFTGAGAATVTSLTAAARAVLAGADAGAMQTAMGISDFVKGMLNDADADTALATLGLSVFMRSLMDDADAATAKRTLLVEAGIFPISASVAGNAMTLTLNPCVIDFRSSTLGSGTINTRLVSSAISTVISSGSTGGTTSGVLSRIFLIAIDNGGTVELAWLHVQGSSLINESNLLTTIAEGGAGAADTAGIAYSTTARSNVPYRLVGYVESTQATAGTWATTPSKIVGGSADTLLWELLGVGSGGQRWQDFSSVGRSVTTTFTNSSGRPITLNVGGFISIAGSSVHVLVNGAVVAQSTSAWAAGKWCFVAGVIIPDGATYSVIGSGGATLTTLNWWELR